MLKLVNIPYNSSDHSTHMLALSRILGFPACIIFKYSKYSKSKNITTICSYNWANRLTKSLYLEYRRIIGEDDMHLNSTGKIIKGYSHFEIMSPSSKYANPSEDDIVKEMEHILKDIPYLSSIVNYCKVNNINIPNYSDDVKRIVNVTLIGNHKL